MARRLRGVALAAARPHSEARGATSDGGAAHLLIKT